jgi:hypothetical protein
MALLRLCIREVGSIGFICWRVRGGKIWSGRLAIGIDLSTWVMGFQQKRLRGRMRLGIWITRMRCGSYVFESNIYRLLS